MNANQPRKDIGVSRLRLAHAIIFFASALAIVAVGLAWAIGGILGLEAASVFGNAIILLVLVNIGPMTLNLFASFWAPARARWHRPKAL